MLHVDYIDLFLVHWPWPMMGKMYKELEYFYLKGKIKAIGVSSFNEAHIETLTEFSKIRPAINQIEISPLNTQKKLIKFCQDRGIAVQAMSTFSHFKSNKPRTEIFTNDILKQIALSHNKSVVQIVLRWLIQQDIIVIPKSRNYNHIKDNISIFDFSLTSDEMEMIDSLNQGKSLNYNPYSHNALKSISPKFMYLISNDK